MANRHPTTAVFLVAILFTTGCSNDDEPQAANPQPDSIVYFEARFLNEGGASYTPLGHSELTHEGNAYQAIAMMVKNVSSRPVTIPEFEMLGEDGRVYNASRWESERFSGIEVNPGLTKSGGLVFKAPADAVHQLRIVGSDKRVDLVPNAKKDLEASKNVDRPCDICGATDAPHLNYSGPYADKRMCSKCNNEYVLGDE